MGKLGEFNNQRMHTQFVGRADFKDVFAVEEIRRFRRINVILWLLVAIGVLITWAMWTMMFVNYAISSGLITILIFVILLIRYGFGKKIKRYARHRNNKDGWQEIDRLPDWAYRKMKRRKKNIVKGEHYLYKREGDRFYKRLKHHG